MPLINEGQVVLDLTGVDRHAATRTLAQTLVTSGRCTDIDTFLADVRKREETMATGLPGGIGIPHARSAAITEPSLVFGRIADGIDWGAKDGPAQLIFLIAAPEAGGDAHMQMLPKLARALMKKEFKAALQAATTEAEIVEIVNNRCFNITTALCWRHILHLILPNKPHYHIAISLCNKLLFIIHNRHYICLRYEAF